MNDPDLACDVCGVTGDFRALEMTFTKGGGTTIYCTLCKGLIESRLIRPELADDGSVVYRQWHMGEWTPGELLPQPKARLQA